MSDLERERDEWAVIARLNAESVQAHLARAQNADAEVERLRGVLARRQEEQAATIARVEALLGEAKVPRMEGKNFDGFVGGPEHRTVGAHRAWCYEASEWCYPTAPCSSCGGTVDLADLRAALYPEEAHDA